MIVQFYQPISSDGVSDGQIWDTCWLKDECINAVRLCLVMAGNSDVRFGEKTDVSQLLRNVCFYWTRKWKVERRLALIKMWSHHKGNHHHHHHLLLLQTQHHRAPLSAYLLVHRRLPQRNISDLCRLTFLCAAVASIGWRKADNYSH